MSGKLCEERVGKYTIEVRCDDFADNPREFDDNLGTFIMAHRRYNFADENVNHAVSAKELRGKGAAVIIPVYGYEHGGMTISTSPFSCPWDSGQLGYIYATHEKILSTFKRKRLSKKLLDNVRLVLEGEIKVMDQYLRGEVLQYVINDSDGNFVDGCGGFYGEPGEVASLGREHALHLCKDEVN